MVWCLSAHLSLPYFFLTLMLMQWSTSSAPMQPAYVSVLLLDILALFNNAISAKSEV